MRRTILLAVLTSALFFTAACASPPPPPPTPTPVPPTPMPTSIPPTATAVPPTATPMPLTATPKVASAAAPAAPAASVTRAPTAPGAVAINESAAAAGLDLQALEQAFKGVQSFRAEFSGEETGIQSSEMPCAALVSKKVTARVHRLVVLSHFVVEVSSGRTARDSHSAD